MGGTAEVYTTRRIARKNSERELLSRKTEFPPQTILLWDRIHVPEFSPE